MEVCRYGSMGCDVFTFNRLGLILFGVNSSQCVTTPKCFTTVCHNTSVCKHTTLCHHTTPRVSSLYAIIAAPSYRIITPHTVSAALATLSLQCVGGGKYGQNGGHVRQEGGEGTGGGEVESVAVVKCRHCRCTANTELMDSRRQDRYPQWL